MSFSFLSRHNALQSNQLFIDSEHLFGLDTVLQIVSKFGELNTWVLGLFWKNNKLRSHTY